MPIIAVVAAVVAVSEAVAVTATVFEIITAVGAVAGAIGAVTGNKTLMKIGALVGIVGGIGTLADSAGLFGAGAGADVAGGAAGATDGVMQMGTAENAGAIGAADAVGGGSGVVATPLAATPEPIGIPTDGAFGSTSLTGSEVSSAVTPGAPIATPTPAATLPDAGAIPSANASTAPVSTSPVPTNPMPTQFATTGSEEALNGNSMLGGHAAQLPATGATPSSSWFDTATDVFKGVAGFANANPNAAAMILQGISSAADPSARAVREAQARGLNANAGYTEQETKNMNGVGGAIQWGLNPAALNQIKPPGNFRTGA